MPKPLDRLLKSLAVDDPRALYYLLSEPLPPEDAEIIPMPHEIITRLSALDYWCELRAGPLKRADVFEFKGRFEAGMHVQALRYAMAAFVATGLPVRAVTVVVSGRGFPANYLEIEPIERAGTRIEFRTVRLWEMDANVALEAGRPWLLSLVPFMRAAWSEVAAAVRSIPREASDILETFWHAFLLRYSKEQAEQLRLEVNMNSAIMERLWKELFPDSPLAEEIRVEARTKGRTEGLTEGREEGKLTEAKEMVRTLLAERFPGVPSESLDSMTGLDDVHGLFRKLLRAGTSEEAQAVLASVAPSR